LADRWYLLKAGLRHHLYAKSRFNLHSPFLHHLSENVLLPARRKPDSPCLKGIRKNLYQDQSTIRKREFGAKIKGDGRVLKAGKMARRVAIPAKHGRLLTGLVQYFGCHQILELGTGAGLGTAYLLQGLAQNSGGDITTMEGCPETLSLAKYHWQYLPESWPAPHCIFGPLHQTLPALMADHQPDFVLVDAHHEKNAVRDFTATLLTNLSPGGIIVLDDIHWSKGMAQAWEALQQDARVQMTVDLFRMGVVFTDPSLSPLNLRLRF
jgi:predicted O-methyltransferase YrrM